MGMLADAIKDAAQIRKQAIINAREELYKAFMIDQVLAIDMEYESEKMMYGRYKNICSALKKLSRN